MLSLVQNVGQIEIPYVEGEYAMMPFDMKTLEGLPEKFKNTTNKLIKHIKNRKGIAYLTVHGRKLRAGNTLRRGGPHTDGNYEPINMCFGTGGWKVGENGPHVGSALHERQYVSPNGGVIMASNYESCTGWSGQYEGIPHVGGNCSHIKLNDGFTLQRNGVYYGNNHFIHESLPVDTDVCRVLYRVTLPEDHKYEGGVI